MKILFYHKYSDLDEVHEFGVVPEGDYNIYHTWVFFYLGIYLSQIYDIDSGECRLFPYKVHSWEKPEKVYTVNGADKVAKLIVNRIKKIVK